MPLDHDTNDRSWLKYLTIFATVISGASIPSSTAAQNIGAALLIITFLFIHKSWEEIKKTLHKPFTLTGLWLGFILAVGTIWSSAPISDSWGFFLKMRAYYLIPVFLMIFSRYKNAHYLIASFATMTFIAVALSCISASFNYPIFIGEPGDWYVFRHHTFHNFFAALLGIGILSILISIKISIIYRITLSATLLIITYDIFFLVVGRTGQIIYLIMICFIILLWNWKIGIALSGTLVLAVSIILPKYSPAFNTGINKAESDLTSYSNGNAFTSIGLRLEWHKNSILLIKEKPLTGHGTGSFKHEYKRIAGPVDSKLLSKNPHNDYLWLGVELGLIGMASIVALMLAAAWQGRNLETAWKWTLYSLLLGMGISTLVNSFFTDNASGLAFVILSCALLSGPKVTKA